MNYGLIITILGIGGTLLVVLNQYKKAKKNSMRRLKRTTSFAMI